MTHLGLTGGIGSGKSTVAKMLAELGAVIIDADAIARSLMAPGQPVLQEVVEHFGEHLLDEHGQLDRHALASIVFNDDQARQTLNSIVHPAVRAETLRQIEAATAEGSGETVLIEDIPLLAETGQAERFDGVIVVTCDQQTRLERLTTHRGMDPADAKARMESQATDAQRTQIATWVIDNSQSLEHTQQQVSELWQSLYSAR
ncbi:dephospho-CoA kinase [Auritidibacter ignavus]|uniref:dephospho-CoA kinase n=1 Tax=Auritidibacter ignavus TaxID=678932 RepID=UPI00244C1CF0|nr:dephospho-CoA kinase [Auritidibacter ignavus]WGH91255.1 dephospho-CoA kinase [Auritidibacter ignavus]